jgi:hypothetical protein
VLEGEQIGTTRVGLPKILYKLTFFGLCMALKYAESNDYERIIQKWRHLDPVLLGRWEYFKQKVGRLEAELFVQLSVSNMRLTIDRQKAWEWFKDEAIWGLFKHYEEGSKRENPEFERNYERLHGQSPKQDFEKWMEAFQADPQLKKFAMEYIERNLEATRENLRWFLYLNRRFSKHS